MIETRNCVFGFECKTVWALLKETPDVNIRHCKTCKKDVHFVLTKEELFDAIDKNLCVAIQSSKTVEFIPLLGLPVGYKSEEKPEFKSLDSNLLPAFLRKIMIKIKELS